MRYETITKVQRNKALLEYADAHPDLSYGEIGVVFGLRTRQRTREIIVRERAKRQPKIQ